MQKQRATFSLDGEVLRAARVAAARAGRRDSELVESRLQELRNAAEGKDNLLPFIRQALRDNCSMGEVCTAMRDVFGTYQPVV